MGTLIFWFYILSLLAFSLAIFSEILLRLTGRINKVPGFPVILLGLFGILLSYTINYFDFLFIPQIAGNAEKIFLFLMVIATTVLTFGIIRIAAFIKTGIIIILSGSVLTLSLFSTVVVFPRPAIFNGILIASITLLMALTIYLFIEIRRRKILLDRKWVSLGYIVIIGIPLEILEFFLFHNRIIDEYIPKGLLSYSAFSLILAVIVIRWNIKALIKKEIYQSEETFDGFRKSYTITPREWDVIEELRKGKSRNDIADSLYISVRTVDRHLNNIYRKCDVRNPVELLNLLN